MDTKHIDHVTSFLGQNPEYVTVLTRAVEHEEKNAKNQHYLGWEWHDVQIYGSKLPKLVVEGLARVNFKSRSATCYRLAEPDAVKAALKKVPA